MAKIVKSNRELTNIDEELDKLNNSKPKKENKKEDKKKDEKKKEVKNKKAKKETKKAVKKESYFSGVKKEVSKIKWPSKDEMIKYSIATFSFILFFSAFFYIIQLLFVLLKKGV